MENFLKDRQAYHSTGSGRLIIPASKKSWQWVSGSKGEKEAVKAN